MGTMDYLFESPVEPDVLLDSAFSRSKPLQGERRLMLAVLWDAVDCYRRGCRTSDPATRLLFDETRTWVESTDRRAIFSFESICDYLGIDADYLRRGLRQRRAPGRGDGDIGSAARRGGSSLASRQSPCAEGDGAGNRDGGRREKVLVAEPASIDSDRETLRPEPALDGLRILLVDDDADARDAIAAVLAECGARVVTVGCGADALQALKNEAPHVLVSDVAMPGMDGHALMRRIREFGGRRGSVSAIALTAYASPMDRTQALLAGYQVFLSKPFDPTELVTLVATLAGSAPSS